MGKVARVGASKAKRGMRLQLASSLESRVLPAAGQKQAHARNKGQVELIEKEGRVGTRNGMWVVHTHCCSGC